MQRLSFSYGRLLNLGCLGLVCAAAPVMVRAADSPTQTRPSDDQLWQQTIDEVMGGDFSTAAKTINDVTASGRLVDEVRTWLADFETKQAKRREMNLADFTKYVEYAKARIERKEYRKALSWALAAMDSAADRDAFLESDWLLNLVNVSLEKASEFRKDGEWLDAFRIYSPLTLLYEQEPRYQKLEHEVLTHYRLDTMFEKKVDKTVTKKVDGEKVADGKSVEEKEADAEFEKTHWEERIEKVRWRDAEKALEYVGLYYVEPAKFKEIAERGLEQLLLLTESEATIKEFDGLKNEFDRKDFEVRVGKLLDRVREAPSLDRRDCVRYFRRVVTRINDETINLPEILLVSELMRGAFEPLDDFTTVIWPRDSKEFDKHTRGNFVGVGISIVQNRDKEIEVVTPLEDSPAYRAGVQAGDIITHCDGQSLKGFSTNKVVDTITGDPGTAVTLTVRRKDERIEFPLTRARVKIRSVKGMRRDPLDQEHWDYWLDKKNGIGYARVLSFQRNTVEDLDNALSELSAEGLRGLVLDLRDNPGGLLDSAWQMSSRFMKRGDTVVSTRGRIKMEDQTLDAPGNGAYADLPLVVLVNGSSASASEIVSGAIRDNHRGIVMGERTFGKFSVQNLIPLGRSGAKLKITTARYYLPNGDSLHRTPTSVTWGVEPDIAMPVVRKERGNRWKMQREANLLGPAHANADSDDNKDGDDGKKSDDKADGDKNKTDNVADGSTDSGDETSEADSDENDGNDDGEPKLPKLVQKDKNDYPKNDPQLDAALLLMRINLLGKAHPSVASAEATEASKTASP